MILIDKILNHLNNVSGISTVMYDSGFSANVRIDRTEMPGALFYLLNSYDIELSGDSKKESADVQVFFFNTCPFDCKGEQKDEILSTIEPLALQFIQLVRSDKTINITTDKIRLESTYGKFDKFVIGYTVSLSIEERQSSCI